MNKKPILIDVSLTGGRGPAKQAYELVTELKSQNIPYMLLTDRIFAKKLGEIGIEANYIVDTDLTQQAEVIINKFEEIINKVDYSLLIKLGARVAGPIASRKKGVPYILVDGGLPDYLSDEENLYEKLTFQKAESIYLTTQFEWEYPKRYDLENIKVCCYPISQKTFRFLDSLKSQSKLEIIDSVKSVLCGNFPNNLDNLLINFMFTGDVFEVINRVTYGGWLTGRQYDQCVGFIRRLLIDLGEKCNKNLYIFLDELVVDVVSDVLSKYPMINPITFKNGWNFRAELALQAASDITISRATNYQPYIAALCKGANVTTPVPADGYMDEDSAGIQYQNFGLTKLFNYDDELYVDKLLQFVNNRSEQQKISSNLKENYNFITDTNLNEEIIRTWHEY